jgi:FkbM family methyltransferase
MTITVSSLIDHYNLNILESPEVIFEIGAREANDSILLKRTYPMASVFAFEAHPECYRKHREHVLKNHVKYYNLPMWSENKKMIFYDKGIHTGISSFRDRGIKYGTSIIELEATTAYDFCVENKIDKIDILKLDVEGCTYEVLHGFGELLSSIKMMHIETEREQHFKDQHTEQEVFLILEKHGFKMLQHSWCCLKQYDSVWIKND